MVNLVVRKPLLSGIDSLQFYNIPLPLSQSEFATVFVRMYVVLVSDKIVNFISMFPILSFAMSFFFTLCVWFQELSKQIEGHTICALGDAAAWPVQVHSN